MKITIQPVTVHPGVATLILIADNWGFINGIPTFGYSLCSVVENKPVRLKSAQVIMTKAQWDNWSTQNDVQYIAECILANLSLQPAS